MKDRKILFALRFSLNFFLCFVSSNFRLPTNKRKPFSVLFLRSVSAFFLFFTFIYLFPHFLHIISIGDEFSVRISSNFHFVETEIENEVNEESRKNTMKWLNFNSSLEYWRKKKMYEIKSITFFLRIFQCVCLCEP